MSFRIPTTTALAAAALGGVLGTAHAAPGDHIRTGDTTITPALGLGYEFASNIYRADADPTAASSLVISPALDLRVDSPQNAFKIGGVWDLRKFLTVSDDGSDSFDRAARIRSLDRFNDFNVSASLDALRKESVGLRLYEKATLNNRETESGLAGSPFTPQRVAKLRGGVRVSPGPALDIVPGAEWAWDEYRMATNSQSQTRFNARNTYGPNLDVKWSFFPRTSFVLRADALFYRWSDNELDATQATGEIFGQSFAVPNSNHYKVRTGLQGRFTERIFLDLQVGYVTAQYDEAAVADEGGDAAADLGGLPGLLASAQARYVLTEETQFSLGYNRDMMDSFFTNYVTYDKLGAGLMADIGGLQPSVSYSIQFESYQGEVVRTDVLNRFDVGLAYDVSKWCVLNSTAYWQQRAIAQTVYQSAEFDDFRVFVGANFLY